MKISFKHKDTSFSLPLPIWLVNIIPSGLINIAIKHNTEPGSDGIPVDIDFHAIKKSLVVLKNYKGLKILEFKNDNGEEIVVTI